MMLPKESATFSSCRFNCFMAFLIPNSRYEVTPTEMKWACDLCRYLHQTQMRVYEELQCGNRQRPMTESELIRTFFKRFEHKGVTQGKLSKLLNTSQPYISQCVNPKAKPKQEKESTEQ